MLQHKWQRFTVTILMIMMFLLATVSAMGLHAWNNTIGDADALMKEQMRQDALAYATGWGNQSDLGGQWNTVDSNLQIGLYTYEQGTSSWKLASGKANNSVSAYRVNILHDLYTNTTWYTDANLPRAGSEIYQVRMSLPSVLKAHDVYWRLKLSCDYENWLHSHRYVFVLVTMAAAALAFWLAFSGRHSFQRYSLDVFVVIALLMGLLMPSFLHAYSYRSLITTGSPVNFLLSLLYLLAFFLVCVQILRIFLHLLQTHTFACDSMIGYAFSHLDSHILSHPVFRGIVYGTVLAAWVIYLMQTGGRIEKLLFSLAVLVPLLDNLILHHGLKVCTKAADEMQNGKTDWRIDDDTLSNVHGAAYDLAIRMNHLGDALEEAVSERTRAQRLQAQLIANVSHDIRTPLTAIISYVDILQKEHTPEQEAEYLAVLARQSERLKRLSEDVLAAAKAENGAIPVHPEQIHVRELLAQAEGEYRERFEKAGLTLCVDETDPGLCVTADGRLLWRAVNNLLDNALKYSLSSSRVYIHTRQEKDDVMICIANVSRAPLNVSAEELMERFVRGDVSRNSEGSGLGLSIARSLIGLMHGTFHITIDGDLFKAEIRLPACAAEAE